MSREFMHTTSEPNFHLIDNEFCLKRSNENPMPKICWQRFLSFDAVVIADFIK